MKIAVETKVVDRRMTLLIGAEEMVVDVPPGGHLEITASAISPGDETLFRAFSDDRQLVGDLKWVRVSVGADAP